MTARPAPPPPSAAIDAAALQVRALTPGDAEAYRALRLAGIREMPAAFATSHAAESALPLGRLQQRLQHTRDQRIFGGFGGDGARLLGMAGFKREPIAVVHDRASLWGVYIAAEARRQGLARQLLLAALAHARTFPELSQLSLKVRRDNTAAIALYRGLGFATGAALPQDEESMLLLL